MVIVDVKCVNGVGAARTLAEAQLEFHKFDFGLNFVDKGKNIARITGEEWVVAIMVGYLRGTNMITHYIHVV